jgi:hypothetical protein
VLSRWIFNRTEESLFGNLVVLAFLVVQALDGTLTYVGLATVGRVAEGNPLVAGLMTALGVGLGLTSAKLVAALLGIALHLFGTHRLIALLTAFYFGAAVIPWVAVLAAMS